MKVRPLEEEKEMSHLFSLLDVRTYNARQSIQYEISTKAIVLLWAMQLTFLGPPIHQTNNKIGIENTARDRWMMLGPHFRKSFAVTVALDAATRSVTGSRLSRLCRLRRLSRLEIGLTDSLLTFGETETFESGLTWAA